MTEPVLVVERLSKSFDNKVRAVDNASFALNRGETLGLVGESGCGKTTLARMIMALERPSAGTILLAGRTQSDWLKRSPKGYRQRLQYVFQDPIMSLNPRKTIAEIIALPLVHMTALTAPQRHERVRELIDLVGLRAEFLNRYPHQFSGGQCQRIGIARALATEPDIVVLDEPVSALDVSIQAQILNLLADLQTRLGLTYLLISHDLAVVENLSDRVLVMQNGAIIEQGECQAIFSQPRHDYTKKLINSIPTLRLER